MSEQAVTLTIPEVVYNKIRQAAEKKDRPVADVMMEVISAAAPTIDMPINQLRASLTQMTYLNDAALWQASRTTIAESEQTRMELLHHKQQHSSLSNNERTELDDLEKLYRDTILVRAQAAVLLKQRGYDISDLSQFTPLE